MYRPASITLRRCLGIWSADVTFVDDGVAEDGGEQTYRGFALERPGSRGLTRRACFRRTCRRIGTLYPPLEFDGS